MNQNPYQAYPGIYYQSSQRPQPPFYFDQQPVHQPYYYHQPPPPQPHLPINNTSSSDNNTDDKQKIHQQLQNIQQPSPLHSPAPSSRGRKRKSDHNSTNPSSGPNRKPRSQPSKVFQCTGYGNCNMQFTRSEHLARHVRKHTGERPFKCHCGKAFSRLDNLRQHASTVHADQPDANDNLLKGMSSLHTQLAASASQRQIADAQVVNRRDQSPNENGNQRGRKRNNYNNNNNNNNNNNTNNTNLNLQSQSPQNGVSPVASTSTPVPSIQQTNPSPIPSIHHRSPYHQQMVPTPPQLPHQFQWSHMYHPPPPPPPPPQAQPAPISAQILSHPTVAVASSAPAIHPIQGPIMQIPPNHQHQFQHPTNVIAATAPDNHLNSSTAQPPVLGEWSPHTQTPTLPPNMNRPTTTTPITNPKLINDNTPTQVNNNNVDDGVNHEKLPSIASVVQSDNQPPPNENVIYQTTIPSPTNPQFKTSSLGGYSDSRPTTSEYFTTAYFDPGYQYSQPPPTSAFAPLPFRKNSYQNANTNGMFGYNLPNESHHPNPHENWDEYSLLPPRSRKSNIQFGNPSNNGNDGVPFLPPPTSSGNMNLPFGFSGSRPMSSSEALRPLSATNNNNNNNNVIQQPPMFKFDPNGKSENDYKEEYNEVEDEDDRPTTNASRRQSVLDLCGGEVGPRNQYQSDNENNNDFDEGDNNNVLPPLKNLANADNNIDNGQHLVGLGIKSDD